MSFGKRRLTDALAVIGLFLVSAATPSSSALAAAKSPWRIPGTTTQLVVGTAAGWDSSEATLQRYVRGGKGWKAVGAPMPARLGANGLVWGRGLSPRSDDMSDKAEGDDRSPAGVFGIGRSFGYSFEWKNRTKLQYTKVTKRDLYVEDPESPLYNTYVHLDHDPNTAFENEQQMNQDDPAHRLKIVIKHNAEPSPMPGKGSAILFHIWRSDGAKTTAGCTAASATSIETLMTWLDPVKQPLYVLLPVDEYRARRAAWGLPVIDPVTSAGATGSSGSSG